MENNEERSIHSNMIQKGNVMNSFTEEALTTLQVKDDVCQVTEIFRDLSADDPDPEIMEIESLCLQCSENGVTRLLLTKIPFYKEIVVMSFRCDHCGWENNELQPAIDIQEKGIMFEVNVKSVKDLSRQVVKSDWASVVFKEIEFEIPSNSQEGTITTIEGVLGRALDGLNSRHKELLVEDPASAKKLFEFLQKLEEIKEGKTPFTFILRDCSGNSFIENICAPQKDPEMTMSYFERSSEENAMLGLMNSDESSTESACKSSEENKNFLQEEVFHFPTNCTSCGASTSTNMKVTQIPHFKDVIIMATSCDACGHRTREVKSGSGIEPLGKKISLKISETADLKRFLIKSDTCSIQIPELELEVGAGTLNGRFTTVEGLLVNIKEQLQEINPLVSGDSAQPKMKKRMDLFLGKIDEIVEGKRIATLILDDPCGNSILDCLVSPNEDHRLVVTEYKRTPEQDEELGISDMKVENYEET